jgi:cytochrome c-type biogenesis protein CcmH
MALFWGIAAALLLLALWMVVAPLRRRPWPAQAGPSASASNLALLRAQLQQIDRDLAQGSIDAAQHQALRTEVERRVLDEESVADVPDRAGSPRGTMLLLLVAVPVLALGLYALIGTPVALSPEARDAAAAEPSPQEVEAMVARLAERMEKQPPGNAADLEGWVMLGRSYAVLQRYPEASRAFARALQLSPNDAQVLVDQADVLAMQQGGSLQGEPQRLIAQALRNDPSNLKALALAGTAAFERKDYAGAVAFWSRARAAMPGDTEFGQSLDRSIAEARAAAGGSLAAATPPSAAASQAAPPVAAEAATGSSSIRGRVTLSPALAAQVAPGDTLFVYARAVDGPRMPLAILKRRGADLPLEFTLDDSMAMSPELKLSRFPSIVLGARLSKSGDAMPRSGDLEGQSAPLAGRSSGIELQIDRVRP